MTAALTTATRLDEVRATIARACERSGRDPLSVRLVGVSKTHGLEAVRDAVAAGLEDFGENRAGELVPKALAAAEAGLRPTWHFISHLQRNKVREVLPHIDTLHSLDSVRLLDEVTARHAGLYPEGWAPVLLCYIEVNVGGEAQKQGIAPAELPALLAAASRARGIEVAGLMTVAPRVEDAEQVRPVFRALRELAAAHGLPGLSMGMTDDYAVAIEEGATVVRVGRAIFGERRS